MFYVLCHNVFISLLMCVCRITIKGYLLTYLLTYKLVRSVSLLRMAIIDRFLNRFTYWNHTHRCWVYPIMCKVFYVGVSSSKSWSTSVVWTCSQLSGWRQLPRHRRPPKKIALGWHSYASRQLDAHQHGRQSLQCSWTSSLFGTICRRTSNTRTLHTAV